MQNWLLLHRNPIELIWAQLKGYVRRRNTTSKITDVEKLVHEAIDSIKPEDWKKCVDHVKKQEEYFREMDAKFESYQSDDFETLQFGQLDEILATDVAAFQLQNPSTFIQWPKSKQSSNRILIFNSFKKNSFFVTSTIYPNSENLEIFLPLSDFMWNPILGDFRVKNCHFEQF